MDWSTYAPNRREFIAGAVGVGAAGLGIKPAGGESPARHPETADASGTVEMVVRFEPAEGAGEATLKRHARTTQRHFERFAAERSGISVERQFWVANAALVSVDLGRVSRSRLLDVESVTTVHPNYAAGTHSVADGADASPSEAGSQQAEETDVAYHLEEMDVPQAQEVYDTRGEGVDVAVIDTGIDTSEHEELAASLERGGWAEFDERGNRVDSEPNAQTGSPLAGHGTSVSGVVAGGTTDDGERYGIAPAVNLYKAQLVSEPPEGIRTLSVVAAIEWAIEQDVDILSMSLGLSQYNRAFVEPVRNSIESGVLLVAGAGNSGRHTSLSPANIPGVLSAGAIDDDREMYANSSGEPIDTERYWGVTAADSWPDEYTVPDVTAPGVDVLSPVLDGQVGRYSGTSLATPCVAGVAALAMAATDADADAVRSAITETARHPAVRDEFDVDPGHDDRYGRGIVSALAAISRLKASETLSGTVTDASGTPLDGVAVISEAGPRTETDAQGRYELTLPPGPQPVGATGLGFDTTASFVDPTETDTRAFELTRTDDLGVELADRMSTRVDPGATATATFDVANAETVVVEIETEGPLGPEMVALSVAGEAAAFGDPVGIDPEETRITVGVDVPDSVVAGQFRLSYEFTGGGESVDGRGHLVHTHPDPLVISPADPPTLQAPVNLVAPRTTVELTDGRGEAVAGADDTAGLVIDKPLTLTAADGATPTVRFSDEGAERPAVVLVTADDVTVSGLEVEGTGAETGVQVAREEAIPRVVPQPSGVTVRDLTVSGAETAVHAGQAPALRVLNNDLTARATAVRVGRRVEFRDSTTVTSRAKTTVRGNAISDVETGIDVAGQVAAIEGNSISNVEAAAIRLGTPRFLSCHWGADIGPIRSNTVTDANRGIVVSGVTTLPVEENTLSEITDTALVVDGAVLAPLRANSVDGAQTGLVIADDGEVATLTDNEFRNIQQPGDEEQSSGTEETETEASDQTDTDDGTTPGEATESTDEPETGVETETDGAGTSDSEASGSGFGVGGALVSLGGAGYLLKRRFSDTEADSDNTPAAE